MHDRSPNDRATERAGNSLARTCGPIDITQLLRAQRFREAREAIERGLIQFPDDTRLLRRLAWACNHLGDAEAAQDALERLSQVVSARELLRTNHSVTPYDHDAVSATEYAEILRKGASPPNHGERLFEPLSADHSDPLGCVTTLTDDSPSPTGIDSIPCSLDEVLAEALPDDDAISDAPEESPAQIVRDAFADAPGRQASIKNFDESAEGLAALNLIEIQEARQATKLTGSARVTRRLRARQQAAAMLSRQGFGESSDIDAVAEIFFHFGWNSCSRALELQLYRGATPCDLAVAHRARVAWASNPLLNASAAFANGSWHAPQSPFPSWTVATALAKAFRGIPSDAEIYALLEREFDRYLASKALQRDYGSFSAYLIDCRLDQTGRHLPPSMSSDFDTDWSLTDTDPADRWESSIPEPRIFDLQELLDSFIDR